MAHGTLASLRVETRLFYLPLSEQGAIDRRHFLIDTHFMVICTAPEEHVVLLIEGSRVEA